MFIRSKQHDPRRSGLVRGLALAAGSLALLLAGQPAAQAQQEIKIAVVGGPNNLLTQALEQFASRVNELAGDEVTAKVYPSAQLGSPREAFALAQQGAIEIATESFANLVSLSNAFEVLHLPYMFLTRDEAHRAVSDPAVREAINTQFVADTNMRWFMTMEIGMRKLGLSREEVHTPADAAGMKLRTSQSPTEIAAVKAFGAAPTSVDWPELYNALKLNVVDGSSVPLGQFYASKQFEALQYVAELDFQWYALVAVMSQDTWDSWSPAVQDAVTEAAAFAEDWYGKAYADAEMRARDAIADFGVKIYGLTGEERQQWIDVARTTWADSGVPQELIDVVEKAKAAE